MNLLPEEIRELAILRLKRDDIDGLDQLILRQQNPKLKEVYVKWKMYHLPVLSIFKVA